MTRNRLPTIAISYQNALYGNPFSDSSSFDQRRLPEALRTVLATAFPLLAHQLADLRVSLGAAQEPPSSGYGAQGLDSSTALAHSPCFFPWCTKNRAPIDIRAVAAPRETRRSTSPRDGSEGKPRGSAKNRSGRMTP